jgi:hypothetical protein
MDLYLTAIEQREEARTSLLRRRLAFGATSGGNSVACVRFGCEVRGGGNQWAIGTSLHSNPHLM